MTNFRTSWYKLDEQHDKLEDLREALDEMIADDLVELSAFELRITLKGQPYVRNVCMALDEYLRKDNSATPMFSKTA